MVQHILQDKNTSLKIITTISFNRKFLIERRNCWFTCRSHSLHFGDFTSHCKFDIQTLEKAMSNDNQQ